MIDLTERNFAAAVNGHPLAIVNIWAPICPPTAEFAAAFQSAASRHGDALFAMVDAEAQQAVLAQFEIRSIPTLMIFRDNVIVFVKSGALPPSALEEVLIAVRGLDMEQVRRKVTSVDAIRLDAATSATSGADVRADAHDQRISIEAFLNPSVHAALADAASRIAAGSMVAIRNAFEPSFAERMHACLDTTAMWRLHEGYEEHFHFHHHNLYDLAESPTELSLCARILESPATKAWATRISGRGCSGPAEISASWYLPGDHSLPHNDVSAGDGDAHRQLAFVWHLAKDWRSEWGGALYWCAKAAYLPASFNTLYLFNVGPESNHFVTSVSPYAQGKRLAINGWWTGPVPTPGPGKTLHGPAVEGSGAPFIVTG